MRRRKILDRIVCKLGLHDWAYSDSNKLRVCRSCLLRQVRINSICKRDIFD